MDKKIARLGLYFYVLNMIIFLLFPEKTFGNIYYLGGYLFICIILFYFIYVKKIA